MRIKTIALEPFANGYTPTADEETTSGKTENYIKVPYCFDTDSVIECAPNRRAGIGCVILLATGGGDPIQRHILEDFENLCKMLDNGDTHDRGQLSGRNYSGTDYDGNGRTD